MSRRAGTTYGLDPHAAIVGHRDYNATQCPGNVFYARLPELRDRVAAVLG
ncbi:peptidoglycan recognition protein family protein [Kribbella steppae]|nr:N-acetylmuramoyl-L-alanine amidase [Kribbella steppae]